MKKVNLAFLFTILFICLSAQNIIFRNPGCNSYDQNGICKTCSTRYYRDINNICQPVNSNCKTYDEVTGDCFSCYPGWGLIQGTCLPGLVTQTKMDPNCNRFDRDVCVKCSFGYYFSKNGACTKADPSCQSFSQLNGDCTKCYAGFALSSGKCNREAIKVIDMNCNQFNNAGQCIKCSSGFYFADANICTKIDDNCKSFSVANRKCMDCYPGYQLNSLAQCFKIIEQVSDVNCAEWKGKVCQKCSIGAAFNNFGKCIILDPQCKQYHILSGLCKACYAGYTLNNLQVCKRSEVQDVKDSLCSEWNQQICVKCSVGAFFANNGKCTQIDPACRAANTINGVCLGCYDGYQLSASGICVKVVEQLSDVNCAQWNGKVCKKCSFGATFNNFGRCILLDSQCREYGSQLGRCRACYSGYALNNLFACIKSANQNVKDPLCASWDGDICTKCSIGSFFNSNGVCSQVEPSCRSFNQLTGDCISCYPGYQLTITKTCVKIVEGSNRNPLCSEFTNGVCLKCSSGSFFNGMGICESIDPLCKTSNALSGACTSCFSGYTVGGSKCVVSIESVRDPLCQEFNELICFKCSFGAYFNSKGFCQLSDTLCSKFNQVTGACTSCYPGHVLVQSKCQVDKTYKVSDPFCAQFNNQMCARCSEGYYFERDGKCRAVDPLCATFNKLNGQCLTCFSGFEIKSGLCVVAAQKASDPNCASFSGNICTECSKGFIFNRNGLCAATNALCRTVEKVTGACTSCYTGYIISGITCIFDKNSAQQSCAEYADNICIRCASRSFMNVNRICQKVSEDCRTYSDLNGNCLSCYLGFSIKSGQCAKDEAQGGCSQINSNGLCTKCALGFYILNGKCTQIDAQCAKFSNELKRCEGCYSGYTLLEGRCEISKVTQQFEVKNCVAYNTDNNCIQCFDRFYLSNNQCKEVNVFCKTYDLISGLCNSCYSTFKLQNGQCKQ